MRVKRGHAKNLKHKKVLKQAKGYRMTYHRLYRRAREAIMHAGQYSFSHRRQRRSQMRNQWIKIIAAGLSNTEDRPSYKDFVAGMKRNNIELDRKTLAYLAEEKPEDFNAITKAALK